MKVEHMQTLADFIANSLDPSSNPDEIRKEVTEWRKQFSGVHYTVDMPS
jgi:glycine hydroxymethyltransferase